MPCVHGLSILSLLNKCFKKASLHSVNGIHGILFSYCVFRVVVLLSVKLQLFLLSSSKRSFITVHC